MSARREKTVVALDTLLPRIAARLFNSPLLVLPDRATTIASNLAARFGIAPMSQPSALAWGDDDDDSEDERRKPYEIVDGVAIVPVRGELVNRGSWLDALSGLTSYEQLGADLRAAAADPLVHSIMLDIDSPGGEAAGAMETAAIVRAISAQKPVTAFVNSLAASAAYAIAAGASEIVVTPSAMVGSIGVVVLHLDQSARLAEEGLKPTLLHAGAFKVDGNQMEPLEPGAKSRILAMIGDYYALFVDSVGAHRPTLGADGARKTEAGVYIGQSGVDAGLADRAGDMAGVIASLKQLHAAKSAAAFKMEGSLKMDEEARQAAVQAQIDAARAEGRKAGDAEGRKAGATEERARIGAILRGPEAEGRAATAASFALDTEMTAEQAAKALGSVPKAAAEAPRLGRLDAIVQRPGLKADAPDAGAGGETERVVGIFAKVFPKAAAS
jgi:signal peptide peptidase SppA